MYWLPENGEKNYSRKHFLCANIHWSFDLTDDLQLATDSAAGVQ